MANALMVIREDVEPFCLPFIADVLRTFPDVQSVAEVPGPKGKRRLTARCGVGADACEVWLDEQGAALHILHPGEYGLELAQRLHAAFAGHGLGGLEVFDQLYSFHVKLRDGADASQRPESR